MEDQRKTSQKPSPDLNLLDLADDYFIPILTHLRIPDFLSVRATCKRFRHIVHRCFSIKFRKLEIALYDDYDPEIDYAFTLNTNRERNLADRGDFDYLQIVFQVFGVSMLKLFLRKIPNRYGCEEGDPDVAFILGWADRYCRQRLTELYLKHNKFECRVIKAFQNVFHNLVKLHIEMCYIDVDVGEWLKLCKNLQQLTLIGLDGDPNSFLPGVVGKLERLFYLPREPEFELIDSMGFLKNHPNLTYVNISQMFNLKTEHLNHMESIELLIVNFRPQWAGDPADLDWRRFFQLSSLRRLEITLSTLVSEPLGKISGEPATNIEFLSLKIRHFGNFHKLFTAFTYRQLKWLKVDFDDIAHDPHEQVCSTKALTENLKNIKELHFTNFKQEFFVLLIEIVQCIELLENLVLTPAYGVHLDMHDFDCLFKAQTPRSHELTVKYVHRREDELNARIQELLNNSNQRIRFNYIDRCYFTYFKLHSYDESFKDKNE